MASQHGQRRGSPLLPLPLLLLLLLLLVDSARASIYDVFRLPSESFQLVAPQWLFAGHGFVNDSDVVYRTDVVSSLCKLTACALCRTC